MYVLTLVAALTLSAPPAKSAAKPDADTEAAKTYSQWALTLYKQARYSEAIAKFEEAYRLKPHPIIFFNIGRCYEQLGDIPRALKNYREYLRLVPEAKDRELVSDAIGNLERRLKEQGVQQITVITDPSSVRVSVDGKYMGLTPMSTEIKPGTHLLALTKDGYEPIEKSVVLSAEKSMELNLSLKQLAVAKPEEKPAEKPAEKPVTKPTDKPTAVALAPSSSVVKSAEPVTIPAPRRFTWIAAGVGGAGLATGVILGLLAQSTGKQLTGATEPLDAQRAQSLYDQTNGFALGANVAYAVGGTALAAGIVLFFLEPSLFASKAVVADAK